MTARVGHSTSVGWGPLRTVEEPIVVSDGTAVFITGAPDGSSVVDGAGGVLMFDVSDGGALHLSNLSLINGMGSYGGAISVISAVVTAENCTFSGNSADEYGGGMYSVAGNVTFESCRFLNNTANIAVAVYLFASDLQVSESTSAGNVASSYGGASLVFGKFYI